MNLVVDNKEIKTLEATSKVVVTKVLPTIEKNYHELDPLSQLKANVNQLEALHFRLNFMVREVRSLIRK